MSHSKYPSILLAFSTSASIFSIVSVSYGRVEDLDVSASVVSMLKLYGESRTRDETLPMQPCDNIPASSSTTARSRRRPSKTAGKIDQWVLEGEYINAADMKPSLFNSRRTSKEPLIYALRLRLVDSESILRDEICDSLTCAGDLTPYSSDIMWDASYGSSQNKHRVSWQA